MKNNVKWLCENNSIEIITITNIEVSLGVKFPIDYINTMVNNDGGYPEPNRFDLDGNEEVFNNLLSFNKEDYSNIVDCYNDIKDLLPKKIIPFAEDPFGNTICFDYRMDEKPSIVFWDHEKAFIDKNLSVSYICDTFKELIEMLHDSKEE